MATLAPSSARRLAIPAPMPREPPVMSAIFPSSFLDIIPLLFRLRSLCGGPRFDAARAVADDELAPHPFPRTFARCALVVPRRRFAYSLRPHPEKRRMHQPAGPCPRPGLDPDLTLQPVRSAPCNSCRSREELKERLEGSWGRCHDEKSPAFFGPCCSSGVSLFQRCPCGS